VTMTITHNGIACPKTDHSTHVAPGGNQTKDIYNQAPPNTYAQTPKHQPYPQHGNFPLSSGPQLPPGWISHWDPSSQRTYYVEQATGRTQWEPPMWQGGPPASGPGYYQSYGNAMPPGMPYQQGHDANQRGYYTDIQSQQNKGQGPGMGTVVAAGIGGAAVGALAANALDDSDDGKWLIQHPVLHSIREIEP
jgi:hypothetical protein